MTTPSALECLQIVDNVDDLVALKVELRHGRMARNNSLGERPFQAFNRILQVQRGTAARSQADCRWSCRWHGIVRNSHEVSSNRAAPAVFVVRARFGMSGRTRLPPARLLASGHETDVLIPLHSLSFCASGFGLWLDTHEFGIEIELMHSVRAKLTTKRSRTPRWRPAGARPFPTPVQPRQDDLVRHALRAHFLPRRPWPAGRYRR